MMRIGILLAGAALALAGCGDQEEILVGPRESVRGGDIALAQQGAVGLSLPAVTQLADWTHKSANARHDRPHAALSPNPQLRLSVPIGMGNDRKHRISTDPVIAGGRIYTVDSRSQVMAHSLAGQVLWRTQVSPGGEPIDDSSGAGLAVSGGRLYVSTTFGELIALDTATGRRVWTQDLGASAAGAPTVSGSSVYVVNRDATAFAINTANGRIRWTEQGVPAAAGVVGGASPAVGSGLVVLPFPGRDLRGLLPEGGTRRWTAAVGGKRLARAYASIADLTGDPVISGGRVYTGSSSGQITAHELTDGRLIWSTDQGAMSPVAVAGGSVFAVSDLNQLVRLSASSGDLIWAVDLPYYKRNQIRRRRDIYAHYGPVLAGGRLWVASSDGTLRAFDPTSGALRAQIELPGGAATNPVVAGGVLYVVNRDGQLLGYR
ncbi:PQQ-binding-like beta-propeller repeat protein [Palleronia caenipelagi]|uniref:Quinoprotein n=1 Tax=Palleronia caenipelagi TaxID=2489174 RepID=A0A547Q342_9RHOB|nr:PQQ-binding-like beta-propeller repeat protein [Palleronia caenipelagi]TRD20799.1 quinoprotein [Palleronia caenipelagi]